MNMYTLIHDVRIQQPRLAGVPDYSHFGSVDILIKGGRIEEISQSRPESIHASRASLVIDGKGLCIAPGFVDTHSHFRDPGQTDKEDIISGAEAAKRGGYTTIVTMANTVPPIDDVESVKYVRDKGATTGINIMPCATVTKGMMGVELTDMKALVDAGAVGFTDDGKPITDGELVYKAMLMAKSLGVPISFHEEDPRYIATPGFNTSPTIRVGLGITGAGEKAEYSMVARDLGLAVETGARIIFQHISCQMSVELIRCFKEMGFNNIFAEATPHHLLLDESDAVRLGTLAKMNPPLRSEEDRLAIIEGLFDGTLDSIATDHAPHTVEEKNRGLIRSPSGVIGLETAFPMVATYLRKSPEFSAMGDDYYPEIIRRISTNPAQAYGFDAGVIRKSAPADFVIFDPNAKWKVDAENFASKARNTPFDGCEVECRVEATICGGKIVYQNLDSCISIMQ